MGDLVTALHRDLWVDLKMEVYEQLSTCFSNPERLDPASALDFLGGFTY